MCFQLHILIRKLPGGKMMVTKALPKMYSPIRLMVPIVSMRLILITMGIWMCFQQQLGAAISPGLKTTETRILLNIRLILVKLQQILFLFMRQM